jgi:protein-disulfide isomerase
MKSFVKLFCIAMLALAACNQQQPNAGASNGSALTDDVFAAAMKRYLKSDAGPEEIGNAMQDYVKKQQAKAETDQVKKQEADLEAQFKNPLKVDVGNSPTKGPKDAPVTIIEFSDFECPFCQRGANTADEILKNYPKEVRLVFKNLPLPFHNNAVPAAKAALAAGKQGKFWQMHDVLFQNQKGLTEELFLNTAKDLGLDIEKFKKDMASDAIAKQIEEDKAAAQKVGISGTPGFLVNGVLVRGAYPFPHFKTIIDRWLEEGKKDGKK